jgi:hypothetical protein
VTIHIRNWERFQHRDVARSKRVPPWIRNYTQLLSDDAYLSLTGTQRAVLHGLWLEHARSRGNVPENTAKLSRRLGLRVTKRTLEAIKQAGFIEFSLAEIQQLASLEEKRGEQELQQPLTTDLEVDVQAEPSTANVVNLDERRGLINGRPIADVVGPLLERARSQSP